MCTNVQFNLYLTVSVNLNNVLGKKNPEKSDNQHQPQLIKVFQPKEFKQLS